MIPQAVLRSDAWQSVKAHLKQELDAARERNDENLDKPQTDALRERIRYIKEMLALDDPSTVIAPSSEAGGVPDYQL